MRNPFAFLKFRIYRRTFYTYCVIMLLLIGSVSGAMLFNARAMGLAQPIIPCWRRSGRMC